MRPTTSLMIALLALVPTLSHAQGNKSAPAPSAQAAAPAAKDEKLDVSDLEKKYWAAKDSDFNVVQNRLFSKAGRFSLTGNYGSMINDPWSDGPTMGASLAYYFNERWGVELAYTKTDTKDNKAADRLKSQGGYPNNNKMKDFYGVQANWVPFYAKMSFLNSSIIYFDMGVSLGAGVTSFEQQREEGGSMKSAPTVSLDLSQQFYLNKWLALRLDYKNRFYNEEVLWFKRTSIPGGVNGNRVDSTDLNHTSILMMGVTLYY
jgi:outer membrane beta-barrel protein